MEMICFHHIYIYHIKESIKKGNKNREIFIIDIRFGRRLVSVPYIKESNKCGYDRGTNEKRGYRTKKQAFQKKNEVSSIYL